STFSILLRQPNDDCGSRRDERRRKGYRRPEEHLHQHEGRT
ncbi:hypothetical protein AVEN_43151-1, partial [Araneus ventricosus]